VLVNQQALGGKAMADLESTVRNAIGIDSARGDRLTMAAMSFEIDSTALKSLTADTATKRDVLVVVERFTRPGIMVLGLVVALVLGLKLLKPVSLPAGAAAPALAAAPAGATLSPGLPGLPEAPPTMSAQLRNRVQAESADSPNMAAQVMRAWLAED
jgi:flagellar biosynthesis/type III secretory pathway M-ring protein FliF/YscJ